ncbi:MAG: radical SAM protein [Verrucomicrobiota bacterium]
MEIVYAMPHQRHRVFVNVIHACPNACLFCVDFKGDTFYGFDLKRGHPATAEQIVEAVKNYPLLRQVTQVYFCGIGEPLLRYEVVVQAATYLRSILSRDVMLAINTSGTFYRWHPRVDFAYRFDLIQVSLNAENETKYNQICRPKFSGAYQALMAFLHHLKHFIDESNAQCRVELTVVDTTEVQYLPEKERKHSNAPKPDLRVCREIAASFGWPLKVKSLIRDCDSGHWQRFADELRANDSGQ